MKNTKNLKKTKKTQSQRETDLRLMLVPTRKNTTQRQMKNEHCAFIPNPQNAKNIKITTQNVKIIAKSIKIFEKYKKSQKNTKSKGNRPKANASSHTENKTQRQVKNEHGTFIPDPQNSKNIKIATQNVKIITKSIKIVEKYEKSQKNKKNTKSKGNRLKANASSHTEKYNSKTNEKRTLRIYPKPPECQEYQNHYPKCQNHSKIH